MPRPAQAERSTRESGTNQICYSPVATLRRNFFFTFVYKLRFESLIACSKVATPIRPPSLRSCDFYGLLSVACALLRANHDWKDRPPRPFRCIFHQRLTAVGQPKRVVETEKWIFQAKN